jgi:trigger factor
MEVTETVAAGLKREYRVVVPATDLETRLNEQLNVLKDRVQLRGFRPGKVPVAHLKRIYGKATMADVIDTAVREVNDKIVTEHGYKLAIEPKIVLPTEADAVEGIISGKSDLAYTLELEIVPPITLADFKTVKIERLAADVTDAEIDQAVQTIADQNRPYTPKNESAEKNDRVTITFSGTIDGKPFEGGSGEDVPIVLGSGGYIAGFEERLDGIKAGESRTFDLTFPESYPAPALAGKEATFSVTAKTVEAPGSVALDDDFAKSLGLESIGSLRDAVRERIRREHAAASRQKIKRMLLDQLDQHHQFEPPPSLVEQEFNNVWSAVENDLKQQGRSFEDEGSTEEKARAEYRAIAERRVRLGLVIAEIGEKNNIKVNEEQLRAAVMEQVRQLPGQEQAVLDYYRNNPGALAALRAPIFEDKVVDFVLELAEVTDKQVSRDELYKEDET